jgi:hypothetical protein
MVEDPSTGSTEMAGSGMVAGDVAGAGGAAPRIEVAVEEITTGRVEDDSEEDAIAAEESRARRAPAAPEDDGGGADLGRNRGSDAMFTKEKTWYAWPIPVCLTG